MAIPSEGETAAAALALKTAGTILASPSPTTQNPAMTAIGVASCNHQNHSAEDGEPADQRRRASGPGGATTPSPKTRPRNIISA